MVKHFLLFAIRGFKKSPGSFLINLVGLSTGLACVIFIALWVNDEKQMNQYHEHSDQLFQVMSNQQYRNELSTFQSTPGVLADALTEEIPEIKYGVTMTWVNNFTLTYGGKNLKSEGINVGKDFFNIFTFPLIAGQPGQVLSDKNSIVISESLAKTIFGSVENAMDKVLEYEHRRNFRVSGVYEDMPGNSTFQFEFVLSFEVFMDENEWVKQWDNNRPLTYVLLNENSDPALVSDKISGFIKFKNEDSNITLFLQPFADRYLYGEYENGQIVGGRIQYVKLFSLIALFILVIACINFMNLSTAKASRRAKEIGVKKAIGVTKGNLIRQFLTESLLLSGASMLVGVLLVHLFLPQFNLITNKQLTLEFTPVFLLVLIGGTLITGLIAGSYPSLYLAKFAPVKVLKGEIRSTTGEIFARRGLVILQFFLSIIFITSVIVIYRQIQFVQNKSLGYNKENVIYASMEGKVNENVDTYLDEVKKIPGVIQATSMGHHLLGQSNNTTSLSWPGKNPDDLILFENVRCNYDMLETMEIEVLEGRGFSRDFSTDSSAIILNESAVKVMDLENPVGETITLWGRRELQVIGVVKDFHFESLHEPVNPLFMILTPESTWYFMVRMEGDDLQETISRVSEHYEKFNPGFILDYHFMDQEYEEMYAAEQRVSSLSKYFAGMAILISCLGLLGLASFTAQKRTKEIGIRKVLGCSNSSIIWLLTRDFSKMILISIVFALPTSYYFMNEWLKRFEYRIDLVWWHFVLAGFIAIGIGWLTVGSQAFKASILNPASCLKDE